MHALRPVRLLATTLLATIAAAQTVWTVGPGGFAEIQPAIAAAAPGDVIEVASGFYDVFTLDKPLTIAALPGASVMVARGIGTTTPTVQLRPPIGTTACVRGLLFLNPWSSYPFWRTETSVERGTVAFEDCVFESAGSYDKPGLRVTGATAVLRHCTAIGFGAATGHVGFQNPGVRCESASLFAIDCWLRGSEDGFDSYGFAAPGVVAIASTVHCVRTRIEGGNDLGPFANGPAPGIDASAASRLWLADSTVLGGNSVAGTAGRPGATAVRHTGPQPMQFDRCTFVPGTGIATAAPIVGPSAQVPMLGLGADSQPLLPGQPWTIAWRAAPGTLVATVGAFDLAPTAVAAAPAVEPVLLEPAGARALSLLVTDANGDAVVSLPIPAVPALRHTRLFVQGFAGVALPVRTAPVLGYLVR